MRFVLITKAEEKGWSERLEQLASDEREHWELWGRSQRLRVEMPLIARGERSILIFESTGA